jgi:hypothetical protein
MSLLVGLLTLPLAPARGVVWLAEQVHTQAERELDGREALSDRLAEVERRREAGELSAEESADLEEQILEELEW